MDLNTKSDAVYDVFMREWHTRSEHLGDYADDPYTRELFESWLAQWLHNATPNDTHLLMLAFFRRQVSR